MPYIISKDFPHDPFIVGCDISIFGMNSPKDLTLRDEPNFKLQTTYLYQYLHIFTNMMITDT